MMMKRQTASGRPVSLEPLESRFCLSAPHGGDFPHDGGDAGASAGAATGGHALHDGQPMQATRMNAPLAAQPRLGGGMADYATQRARYLIVHASNFVFVIKLPPTFFLPGFNAPPMTDAGAEANAGESDSSTAARSSTARGAVTSQVQVPARAAAEV